MNVKQFIEQLSRLPLKVQEKSEILITDTHGNTRDISTVEVLSYAYPAVVLHMETC